MVRLVKAHLGGWNKKVGNKLLFQLITYILTVGRLVKHFCFQLIPKWPKFYVRSDYPPPIGDAAGLKHQEKNDNQTET